MNEIEDRDIDDGNPQILNRKNSNSSVIILTQNATAHN
jgi:hypothetical protein